MDDGSARHRWGPAPSGESRHRSVCRRCGLEECTSWRRTIDGRVIEVVTWVAPTGAVLAVRPVHGAPPPARASGGEALWEQPSPAPAVVDALAHCPGTPTAWES